MTIFSKIKLQIEKIILNVAIFFIQKYSIKIYSSRYIDYFKSELNWINSDSVNTVNFNLVLKNLKLLVSLINCQNLTKSDEEKLISMFQRIIQLEPLTPLTFSDSEFYENSDINNLRQNKRLKSVYLNTNNKVIYTEAILFLPKYTVLDLSGNLILSEKQGLPYTGPVFIIKENGTFSWFDSALTEVNTNNFNPDLKFIVPLYMIEYPEGWYIPFVKEKDLTDAKRVYKINEVNPDIANRYLEEELNFNNGEYRTELLNRIKFLVLTVLTQ